MPNTAVNASFTAVNASLAAQAAAAEARAHTERCKAEMLVYQPGTASITQMQSYAECVQRVYPEAKSPEDIFFWKIVVLSALAVVVVSMVIGALKEPYDMLFGAVGGLMFGFCAWLLCAGIFAAVYFLVH